MAGALAFAAFGAASWERQGLQPPQSRLQPGAVAHRPEPSLLTGWWLQSQAWGVVRAAAAIAVVHRSSQRGRGCLKGDGTKQHSLAAARGRAAARRPASSMAALGADEGAAEASGDWHSASSLRRAWRSSRRASVVGSVQAGWAESVCANSAANKGPVSQSLAYTNLALVGAPPLLWVAFVDTDEEQGMRRAALARLLFQDVCEAMESSHMLESAASCALPAERGGHEEDSRFETPAHCQAAMASPDFPIPDGLGRFDVVVAVSESAREQLVASDPTGAFSHKVVCLMDFVDHGSDALLDGTDPLFENISDVRMGRYTDLPGGSDQLAVMLRSLNGLESFLIQQFPLDMVGRLLPCFTPRSFTPEMHEMLEALS